MVKELHAHVYSIKIMQEDIHLMTRRLLKVRLNRNRRIRTNDGRVGRRNHVSRCGLLGQLNQT